jgi:16S rRNA (guanine527-N7)-methyltransferase
MGDAVKTLIEQSLSALEVQVGEDAADKLVMYANEIVRFGKRINLTGTPNAEDFVRGPMFDALTLIKVLDPKGSLVDMGSGGGLPGIPAAIAVPQVSVTLVEPRSRRTAFLRHVVHMLALEIEILECRDEEIDGRVWSGAVAQAVWPPKQWLKKAQCLIGENGAVYALTSRPLDPAD